MEFLAKIHPEAVHFPIAFLLAYVFFEILGIVLNKEFISKTAHLFLLLGVLGLIAAVLTGNQAKDIAHYLSNKGVSISLKAINEHEDYANITLWYFAALLVFRTMAVIKKRFLGMIKYSFIILAFIGAFLVYETAGHGGTLVYKHGIGTDLKEMKINSSNPGSGGE
jgi:uncharacterized membrane protein